MTEKTKRGLVAVLLATLTVPLCQNPAICKVRAAFISGRQLLVVSTSGAVAIQPISESNPASIPVHLKGGLIAAGPAPNGGFAGVVRTAQGNWLVDIGSDGAVTIVAQLPRIPQKDRIIDHVIGYPSGYVVRAEKKNSSPYEVPATTMVYRAGRWSVCSDNVLRALGVGANVRGMGWGVLGGTAYIFNSMDRLHPWYYYDDRDAGLAAALFGGGNATFHLMIPLSMLKKVGAAASWPPGAFPVPCLRTDMVACALPSKSPRTMVLSVFNRSGRLLSTGRISMPSAQIPLLSARGLFDPWLVVLDPDSYIRLGPEGGLLHGRLTPAPPLPRAKVVYSSDQTDVESALWDVIQEEDGRQGKYVSLATLERDGEIADPLLPKCPWEPAYRFTLTLKPHRRGFIITAVPVHKDGLASYWADETMSDARIGSP